MKRIIPFIILLNLSVLAVAAIVLARYDIGALFADDQHLPFIFRSGVALNVLALAALWIAADGLVFIYCKMQRRR